jgi:hypothetical protein
MEILAESEMFCDTDTNLKNNQLIDDFSLERYYDKKLLSMNQFLELYERIGKRSIVTRVDNYLTKEQVEEISHLCNQNNISHDIKLEYEDKNRLPFNRCDAFMFDAENSEEEVSMIFDCPLVPYYLTYYVPWNGFVQLIKGTYPLKTPEEYKKILFIRDLPGKKIDEANMLARFNYIANTPDLDKTCIM